MTDLVQKIQNHKYQFLTNILSHVAHEINNPLTMIYNRSNALVGRLEKGELPKEHIISELKKVEASVERISKLLRTTRSFFRYAPIENSIEFSAGEIVENIESYFRSSLEKKGIELTVVSEITKDSEILSRKGDPQNLTMALYEIVNNSKESIQKKGSGEINLVLKAVGSGFEIQVSDSGPGFSTDSVQNFGKAYYSTKPGHLGIGLAFSKHLLAQINCDLKVSEDKKVLRLIFY